MPDTVYIVLETKKGKAPAMTPYMSKDSARQHYEENMAVYADIFKTPPHIPLLENEDRTHFTCGDFACGIYEEEVYA